MEEKGENLLVAALLVALAAAAWRFLLLGSKPLLPTEAAQALAAWGVAAGQGVPAGVPWPHDALFFALNTASFFVTASSDFLARFWPALLGTGLVLLPLAMPWRSNGKLLERVAFSGLMATSPLLIFTSRRLDGSIGAAFGVLAFLVAAQREERWASWAMGASLALVTLSGPVGVTFLVIILFLGAWLWTLPEAREVHDRLLARWRPATAAFLMTFLFVATIGFTWLSGLGVAADGFAEWFRRFVVPSGLPWWWGTLHLVLDEPLILASALVAAVGLSRRKDVWGWALLAWAFLAWLLMLWQPGRGPGDTVAVLVPLAWLGSEPVAELLRRLSRTKGVVFWATATATLIMAGYSTVVLAFFTERSQKPFLLLFSAGVFLAIALPFLAMPYLGKEKVALVFGSVALVMLGLYAFHLDYALNLDGARQRANALLPWAPGEGLADLTHDLRVESWHWVGDGSLLPVDVVGIAPEVSWMLRWEMRDFANLSAEDVLPLKPADVVITGNVEKPPAGLSGYMGQPFTLFQETSPASLDRGQWLRWVQYRKMWPPDGITRAVLWVKPVGVGK